MNAEQLQALGQLSLDLHRAQRNEAGKKTAYHEAWRSVELDGDDPELYGPDEYRVRRGSERWDELIAKTHDEYMAWQNAKKEAYKLKTKWLRTCRKLAP